MIAAFDPAFLGEARRLAPAWPLWLNVGAPGVPIDEMLAEAVTLGCRGISVDRSIASKALVDTAREQGIAIATWTVLDADDFARLARMGVAAIFIEGPILQDVRLDTGAGWLGWD